LLFYAFYGVETKKGKGNLYKFSLEMHPIHPPFRLVISDIDGTLLDDAGNLPELNRQALVHCRDLGIATCLATGRRWTTCSKLLDRLNLHDLIDFCILNNGMLVRQVNSGKILFRKDFPMVLILEIVARWKSLDFEPIILGHNPDGQTKDVFYRREALLNADFIAKNTAHASQVTSWQDLAEAHLVELVLIGTQFDLLRAQGALAGLEVETVILRNSMYAEYMLEITPMGVSKWLGTQQLLSHLGLGMHQAMAVGDSENDYQLLKHLPLSIAMANGDEKVKAVAKEITGTNFEGGFGQAVFRHLSRSIEP
jgi:Cof subfamily protein (haloacid dehalogenase superfamily)